MNITHTYCCQCTDIVSGVTGCFVFHNDKPFEAISPVFNNLVPLYQWMRANGWECVHELETPWGCRKLSPDTVVAYNKLFTVNNTQETVTHAPPL